MSKLTFSDSYNYGYIDYLRLLATFLVILIHNGDTFLSFENSFSIKWGYANVLQSFARISVPLFFMISGFLLLKPNIELKEFYLKRLNRIMIPWLFWSFFYVLFRVYFENNKISPFSAFRLILIDEVYYHLWFIYVIIGFYITIPFISKFIKQKEKGQSFLLLFVLIWFGSVSLVPFLAHFAELYLDLNFTPKFYLNMFSGFIGFLPLGYLLGKLEVNKISIYIALGVFLLSFIITILGNYFYNLNRVNFSQYFNGYTKPNIVLMASSVFYLFRALPLKENLKMIKQLCFLSFGIYLVHPVFIVIFKNIEITKSLFESNYLLTRTIVIFFTTTILVYLISKITYLKKII